MSNPVQYAPNSAHDLHPHLFPPGDPDHGIPVDGYGVFINPDKPVTKTTDIKENLSDDKTTEPVNVVEFEKETEYVTVDTEIKDEPQKSEIQSEFIPQPLFVDESVENTPEESDVKPLVEQDENIFRYIGEAFKTYIIIEKNSKELLLIDKHAAHERIIYEKLKKEKGNGYSQLLLQPVSVVLNKIDYNSVIDNLDMLNDVGFEVEDFGNGVVLVRSTPQYLEKEDVEQSIIEMAGYLSENRKNIRTEQMDWIYHNVACRAAIKAGNTSTDMELIDIAKKLENDESLKFCPHGRPLTITIKKREIEKMFCRV